MTEAIVGIPLPRDVVDVLARAQGGLAVGRHVAPEDLTLSLADLSEVPDETLAAVRRGLGGVSANAFSLAVEGLDTTGGNAPVAVSAAVPLTPSLKDLHARVGQAVREAGVPLAYQKYTPSIVLSRFAAMGQHDLKQIMSFLSRRSGLKAGPFLVSEFALYAVVAGEDGPRLEVIEDYPLSGRLIRA